MSTRIAIKGILQNLRDETKTYEGTPISKSPSTFTLNVDEIPDSLTIEEASIGKLIDILFTAKITEIGKHGVVFQIEDIKSVNPRGVTPPKQDERDEVGTPGIGF